MSSHGPARGRDLVLASAFGAWGLLGAWLAHAESDRWLIALSCLPVAAALAWRRSAPLAVGLVLLGAWLAQLWLVPELIPAWGITPELLPPLAVFGVAAYRRPPARAAWEGAGAAAVFGAAAVVYSWSEALPFHEPLGLYVYPLATIAGGLAAGIALRDRSVELEQATERLRDAERARETDAARMDAARLALAREIHAHMAVQIELMSVFVANARRALDGGPASALVAAMNGLQEAATATMHALRATLTVLGDEPGGRSGSGDGADAQLRQVAAMDGARRGSVRVAVTVGGRLPEPLRGLAVLSRHIAEDGVELLLSCARGPARLHLDAAEDGLVLTLSARGWRWWRRARGSVERARLLAAADVGGTFATPRPWRPRLVVRLPARPGAGPRPRRPWSERLGVRRPALDPGMGLLAALVPVALLAVLGVVELVLTDVPGAPTGLRLAGALLAPLPLLYRARWPLAVVCAVGALVVGRQLLGDLGTPTISQTFLLYLAMFVAGAYARSAPAAIAGWLVVLAAGLGGLLYEQVHYPLDAYVFFAWAFGASAAVGVSVRRRVRQTAELDRVRVRLAERERSAVETAVRTERMHVARELHDVVGHSVTLMAVQAGAAATLAERDPAAARQSAMSVIEYEAVARAELDQLLRALRGVGAETATPARLADLVDLVERARRGGLPVRFESEGDLGAVAPWLVGTAYRIVQEALTNVRRHAGGAATTVVVAVEPAELRVEVGNEPGAGEPARAGGPGAGIAGMRERTVAHGGSFSARPTPEGGWSVCARLPLREHEPPPA